MKHITYLMLACLLLVGCAKKEPVASIPPSEFIAHAPRGNFSTASIAALEELKEKAATPIEKGVADLLILAQYQSPDSPHKVEVYREKLKAVADAHPGTWIAIQAKTGLVESYSPFDNTKERQALLESMLDDPGLAQIANPTDPYVVEFMKRGESVEIAKSPRDFVLSRLVYEHTSGYDLEGAEEIAAQITQPYWKKFADVHVEQLRKVPPDVVAKRREAFLKGQKS